MFINYHKSTVNNPKYFYHKQIKRCYQITSQPITETKTVNAVIYSFILINWLQSFVLFLSGFGNSGYTSKSLQTWKCPFTSLGIKHLEITKKVSEKEIQIPQCVRES